MNQISSEVLAATPDREGRFGGYGGRYVSETLIAALDELEALYDRLSEKTHWVTYQKAVE